MRLGVTVPTVGPAATEPGIAAIAQAAEAAGAEALWVSDHLAMIDTERFGYPYTSDRRPRWAMDSDYFEALVSLAVVATVTQCCRIGTAIMVLPQRNVLEVAKTTASLDCLSDGRLTLGVGAGWFEAEFAALGYSFGDRGQRFDEMLRALRACWSGRPQKITGAQVFLPNGVIMHPVPRQPGGPPLLVGGHSRAALRRAALEGDGWIESSSAKGLEMELTMVAKRLALVRQWRAEGGRPDTFTTIVKVNGFARSTAASIRNVELVEQLGFDEVIVEFDWRDGVAGPAEAIAAIASERKRKPTLDWSERAESN